MPAVLWDRVTLTCQGSGTASAATRYKDRQHCWQGRNTVCVTKSGIYTFDRPGRGLSPPVRLLDAAPQWPLQVQGLGGILGMAGVSASASLLALLSAGAGASPRAHCGVPPDSQLPQHPQPPAALSPPPARVLLGRAGGGGPAEVLLVPAMGGLSSRNYSCEVCPEGGAVPNSSARLHIAVPMPVDNATITPSVLEVTLPETGTHRDTVAAGVGGALLFLLLLVAVIVAWHWWHRVDARKHQERAPPDPLAPPVEDPQATYMELRRQPWEPSDIYGNLHQKL
ncbi:uncharacterized protein LOC141730006 isoform X2 [Zonotrichia albicollis]|uniref:uncharacterized protein LOC141730006 isoform X2 n=1 Tax=Zonotrichia albicollis TaxID=44394 RepID=UPI003D80FE8F